MTQGGAPANRDDAKGEAMSAEHHDRLFESISALVMRHSPSGMEDEVDALLKERFDAMGLRAESDASGNLIVKIPGSGSGSVAITAHKDEIGATVTAIAEDGRLRVRKRGGSFPWVYGEGVVDVLGSSECVSGVLSFGSRHVTHASPQHAHRESAPVRWSDAWVETKRTPAELDAAGIRPGVPMVIGRHRKAPFRMKDYIASYALDDKASLAILLELAKRLRTPRQDIYLVATTREEVSASGALYLRGAMSWMR